MANYLGQYCITVSDLERSEDFYTRILGLRVEQRIEIPEAREIVLSGTGSDTKVQLAQRVDQEGPVIHGTALWKHYLYTDDIDGVYREAIAFGCEAVTSPTQLEEWPVTVAFVRDPDGYLIEIIERR